MADTVFKLNRAGSIALVTIDNGEDYRVPTTLGRSAFESAVAVLDELERGEWSAAVFTGKPFVFCVGADIDEFGRIEDPREGIRAGHALFARIRALAFPTVAAINGACLGGGLELALHCDARTIASSVRHIGFPEVALSIIPGWGGTQLLPKLVGPETAARVIVLNPLRQNKLLTASEAVELGIADRLLDPVEFVDESLAFASSLAIEREAPDWSALDDIVRKTRSRIEDAVHGATRAPYVALDLIAGARDWTIDEGYVAEEDAMAELLVSPQARAAAYSFTVVERRAKRPPNLPDAKPRSVQKVGIVGAGLMATQLATLFLRRLQVPVVLRDLDQERVDEALATIREQVNPFLGSIVDGGTDWERFEGCDLIVEAVFEDIEVKRDVLAQARAVAPGAILATNTSSLSVEGMGADVALHFFNPVAVMPLVEIARTSRTTDEQLATAWEVVKKLKKRGVLVADAPGFVVNRLLTRMTTALMGTRMEDADEAILSLGMPMAPSVLREMVGPAVAEHVLETMHGAWPDRFPLEAAAGADGRSVEEIRDDAVDAVADEVQHLLAEGVVADPADVDACLILGAGWPLFLGGMVTRSGKIPA
ncbi:MAG TPA: 3-hydroxyacyl-CoA dehydrogenase NAD-binding domain-containing protein [Gaiellaceae bacterium]|nr:3-hydroxyacyl-CoA dehydrogenase NAD-binding domain-containing protein [Gaiellaceae bacterium]